MRLITIITIMILNISVICYWKYYNPIQAFQSQSNIIPTSLTVMFECMCLLSNPNTNINNDNNNNNNSSSNHIFESWCYMCLNCYSSTQAFQSQSNLIPTSLTVICVNWLIVLLKGNSFEHYCYIPHSGVPIPIQSNSN